MAEHLALTTDLGDRTVTRAQVQGWELDRARTVYRFLTRTPAPPAAGVDELRELLFDVKRRIGPAGLERRVASRVRLSDVVMNLASVVARGERVASSIRIQVPSGSAEAFAAWFTAQSDLPDSDAMLAACPDHYVIGDDPDGNQKVIETTGGSPLPTRFFIDYADVSTLRTPASPDFPVQIAGVARTAAGREVGGVRHQFRDLGDGYEAWLTVEFPRGVPQSMVRGHRWHLACEFGNWIEFQQQ